MFFNVTVNYLEFFGALVDPGGGGIYLILSKMFIEIWPKHAQNDYNFILFQLLTLLMIFNPLPVDKVHALVKSWVRHSSI